MRRSREDYLRIMYELCEDDSDSLKDIKDSLIKSTNVSKKLNISKSSVSQMIRKLKEDKLISLEPYSKIRFTKRGFDEARKLTKIHRIIEIFLKDTLKLKSNLVYEESHRLEHAFSDEGIKKLDKFLKTPKTCLDGRKIPR